MKVKFWENCGETSRKRVGTNDFKCDDQWERERVGKTSAGLAEQSVRHNDQHSLIVRIIRDKELSNMPVK